MKKLILSSVLSLFITNKVNANDYFKTVFHASALVGNTTYNIDTELNSPSTLAIPQAIKAKGWDCFIKPRELSNDGTLFTQIIGCVNDDDSGTFIEARCHSSRVDSDYEQFALGVDKTTIFLAIVCGTK